MRVTVDFVQGKEFRMCMRGHEVRVDVPPEKGGADAAAMPPELVVAALGGCMGIYAVNYLQQAGLSVEGLGLELDFEMAENPRRIGTIRVWLKYPGDLGERREALKKVITSCTVYNSLCNPPQIDVRIE